MKVICAGFWKTGTKSLAEALRLLGYKVYDYDYQYFEFPELWRKFIDGTVTDEDIRRNLKDVDAIIDGPVIAFWEEISRAIPEAKVILSTRDEDSWWKSYKATITEVPLYFKFLFLLMYFTPSGRDFFRHNLRIGSLCMGVEGPFALPFWSFDDNPRLYKYKYRKHNGHVKANVPKEKLLLFEAKDGWEPLCKFLGKDVPDFPYPYKNKNGAHFKTEGGPQHPHWKRIMIEELVMLSILVALLSILAYYLFC